MNSGKSVSELALPYLSIKNNGLKKKKIPFTGDKLIIGRLKNFNTKLRKVNWCRDLISEYLI